ncbi:hypothetical protein Avbf_18019 [Armadillidium vulgare]|nr:hypothetical protein Avbf_18019 [Armadillidium vulgare]
MKYADVCAKYNHSVLTFFSIIDQRISSSQSENFKENSKLINVIVTVFPISINISFPLIDSDKHSLLVH